MNASVRARADVNRNQVKLYSRTWDGIDQPEYTALYDMNANEALALAKALLEAAEQIAPPPKPARGHRFFLSLWLSSERYNGRHDGDCDPEPTK